MTTEDSRATAWSVAPTLHGRHVSIEPLRREHAAGLEDAAADGKLWELWYTNVPEPGHMDAHVARALAEPAQMAFVVRDGSGRIAGTTRFYDMAPATPRLQIGYTWYARRVQRTGLNTEAKLLLLAHAFETLGCIAVGLQTSARNQASRTAIARLGAKQDGITRHDQRHRDGSIRDTVNFSIIDAEWPGVKAALLAKLEAHAHG